jgi:hypothetical protein
LILAGGQDVVLFEHGQVGQTVPHAHLHVVPVFLDMTDWIKGDFPDAAFEIVDGMQDLFERYARTPRPYLFWCQPGLRSMVCWDPPAPPQYLRRVLAFLLGRPERGDWRTMDRSMDNLIIQLAVEELKPYL